MWLAKRTQEQLQEMVRRKQSLSLDLKRVLPGSSCEDDASNSCEETAFSCDSKCFQEFSNRKFQIASALNLPQSIPSSDTMETFHTAAADSPEPCIAFKDADTTQTSDLPKNKSANSEERKANDNKFCHRLMCDDKNLSEIESKNQANVNKSTLNEAKVESTSDDEKIKPSSMSIIAESMVQDSLESPIQRNPAMKKLNQRIAHQRIMVMRCLDSGSPSKEELNRQIMILQDLQRQQIELEVSLLEDERKTHTSRQVQCGGDDDSGNCDGADDGEPVANKAVDYVQNEPNAYCSVVESTNNSSAILLTVAQTKSQLFRNNRPNTNSDQETLSKSLATKRSSSRGYSTVYLTVSLVPQRVIPHTFHRPERF